MPGVLVPLEAIIMLLVPVFAGDIFVPLTLPFTVFELAPSPFKVICGDVDMVLPVTLLAIERSATTPEGTVKDNAF